MVTRNPCCHPGDIRLVQAVDEQTLLSRLPEVPEEEREAYKQKVKHLGLLVNVIVFNVQAERPEQNKMAGGDLDGDVYHMFWDQDLVAALQKARIHEP